MKHIHEVSFKNRCYSQPQTINSSLVLFSSFFSHSSELSVGVMLFLFPGTCAKYDPFPKGFAPSTTPDLSQPKWLCRHRAAVQICLALIKNAVFTRLESHNVTTNYVVAHSTAILYIQLNVSCKSYIWILGCLDVVFGCWMLYVAILYQQFAQHKTHTFFKS